MRHKIWVLKDSVGEIIDRVIADESFISANLPNYERLYSDSEIVRIELEEREARERFWRDNELTRTDGLMLLSDYPYKEALLAYRQELRDWPSQEGWPDLDRPTMGA